MRSKLFRILFVAFQAVWLNAIVPGHTRGSITLSGDGCCGVQAAGLASEAGASGVDRKCCPKPGTAGNGAGRGGERIPTPADKAKCALCFFAAQMTPPPVVDLTPPPLELLSVGAVVAPEVADSRDLILSYHGRAPPAIA